METVGSTDPKMPLSDEVEQQLCLLMKNVTATNNVALNRLENLLQPGNLQSIVSSSVSGVIIYSWPEYRGPLSNATRMAGLFIFLSDFCPYD